jgi:hypothetical protein
MDVGRTIITLLAKTHRLPIPALPSEKKIQEMMTLLRRKNIIGGCFLRRWEEEALLAEHRVAWRGLLWLW